MNQEHLWAFLNWNSKESVQISAMGVSAEIGCSWSTFIESELSDMDFLTDKKLMDLDNRKRFKKFKPEEIEFYDMVNQDYLLRRLRRLILSPNYDRRNTRSLIESGERTPYQKGD